LRDIGTTFDNIVHDAFLTGLGDYRRGFVKTRLDELYSLGRDAIANLDIQELGDQLINRARDLKSRRHDASPRRRHARGGPDLSEDDSYVPSFPPNLLSYAQLEDQGHTLGIVPNGFSICTPEGYVLIASKHDTTRIYRFTSCRTIPNPATRGKDLIPATYTALAKPNQRTSTRYRALRLLNRCGDSVWLAVAPPPATLVLDRTGYKSRKCIEAL